MTISYAARQEHIKTEFRLKQLPILRSLVNADLFPTRHTTYYCYRFGNLTAWAINCKGIQHAVRYIRDNNLDLEILTGSHWFSTNCD